MQSLRLRVTGAYITRTLDLMDNAGISLTRIEFPDEYTLQFSIQQRQIASVRQICTYLGDDVAIIGGSERHCHVRSVLQRPVLSGGVLLMLFLTIWLTEHVLFIHVEGNCAVSEMLVLDIADSCGLFVGVNSNAVHSENIKNDILAKIPQLQWVGVKITGCVCTVSIRERAGHQESKSDLGISNIIASQNGVIRMVTVLQGNALCAPGEAVQKGQVLISGYTDCGIYMQATQAKGEVYADTLRFLKVISPASCIQKKDLISVDKKYSLIIGKNRINLYNSSGNLGVGCDKMCSSIQVTLPGGFILPVSIVTETIVQYSTEMRRSEPSEKALRLSADAYIRTQMISGRILSSQEYVLHESDAVVLVARYACNEMIGIIYPERYD